MLVERIKPIRDKMPNAKWAEITEACYGKLIDLTAKYMTNDDSIKDYSVYGLTCSEVEIDVLTGTILLTRVDILEDTGQSISPLLDVGQVCSFYYGFFFRKDIFHFVTG